MELPQLSGDPVLGRLALLAVEAGAKPFFVLTANCDLVHASRPAWMLLQADGPFSVRGGRLLVRRRAEYAQLKQAVQRVHADSSAAMVRLHNRQGDVNLLLSVRAVPQDDRVILLVADLRNRTLLPHGWSCATLDLPPGLAELAEALTDGETLAQFGDRTGLSFEGARTRLRKLFERTGTKSQMELTALIHRAATVVFLPDTE